MTEDQHSTEIAELMAALAAAQALMQNPPVDSKNTHFGSRYASLAAVRNAVMPALTAEGIAVTQLVHTEERSIVCTTVLWHKSGQYLSNTLRLPVLPQPRRRGQDEMPVPEGGVLGPQAYGIAITYARRFALMAICNVAGDEDTDGEEDGGGRTRPRPAARPEGAPRGVNMVTGEVDPIDPTEELRITLLREIHRDLTDIVRPLRHAGLYKAVVQHSFGVEPDALPRQSLETLERGVGLFRHLCDQLALTGKPAMHPDEWIASKVRELAQQADELAAEGEEAPATAASDLWQQEEAAEREEATP